MKTLFGMLLSLFRWLIEVNELGTDLLANVLSRFARRVSLAAVLVVGGGAAYKLAVASRNSAGTYSLATNPVTTLQVITPSLWNNTFSDLATSTTDSLDRNGRGGMLAALRGIDGTVAAPAFSYTSETGSGEYRIGAGDLGWAILGGKKMELTGSGLSLGGTALSAPVAPYLSLLGGAAQYNLYMQDTRGATGNKVGRIIYDGSSLSGGTGNLAKPGWQFQNVDDTGAFVGGGLTIYRDGSVTIGASGTAISGSFAGSGTLTPGSIAAGSCSLGGISSPSITVTGASSGGVCTLGAPTMAQFSFQCAPKTNGCDVVWCNITTGAVTPPSQSYACRVFNP